MPPEWQGATTVGSLGKKPEPGMLPVFEMLQKAMAQDVTRNRRSFEASLYNLKKDVPAEYKIQNDWFELGLQTNRKSIPIRH